MTARDVWQASVRYAECDQQGIVFNAHYLIWVDEAASAHWELMGLPLAPGGELGGETVVKAAALEWWSSARWGDVVSVDACVERVGRTSVTMVYNVRVRDRRCCLVTLTYVWVTPEGPQELPSLVREALEASTASTSLAR